VRSFETASGWIGLALLSTPIVTALGKPTWMNAEPALENKRPQKPGKFYTIEPGTGRVRAVR